MNSNSPGEPIEAHHLVPLTSQGIISQPNLVRILCLNASISVKCSIGTLFRRQAHNDSAGAVTSSGGGTQAIPAFQLRRSEGVASAVQTCSISFMRLAVLYERKPTNASREPSSDEYTLMHPGVAVPDKALSELRGDAVIGQRAHESVPQRMKTLARHRPALA